MKPAFKKEEGTVTAGNASTLNDGAGAVVMASAEKAKALGLKPLARLVSYGHAGVEPEFMGIGPVPASRNALAKAGLTVADMDLIEALLERPGQVLSRAQIEERLYGWGEEVESNAVEVHIHNLRKKLGAGYIQNVRGVGYRVRSTA